MRLRPIVLLTLVLSWRTFGQTYTITTVAGNGSAGFSGDNGPAISSELTFPEGVAIDVAGNLYIADRANGRIRKVSNGVITTVAGSGACSCSFGGDNGPAASALLYVPAGIGVDSAGNVYIADTGNNRIRKVSNGIITTVAGNGTQGFSGDNGPAASAQLNTPTGVAVDLAGSLYVADYNNNRIRKVSNGVITTVAGNGMCCTIAGDNGAAIEAVLNNPYGVSVDKTGSLFIADTGNNRIRKVSNGIITTFAGGGGPGGSSLIGDNGPAASALLSNPSGVAEDSAGNLYIADTAYYRIRKVSNGVITTVAGNGECCGFGGDNGPAASALLNSPYGVAVNSSGNIFIADAGNNRVRALTPIGSGLITAGSMAQLAFSGGWTTTFTLVNTGATPIEGSLSFFDNNGNPLPVPLALSQSSVAAGGPVTSTTVTVNPGAGVLVEAAGPTSQPTQVGWTQLLANGGLQGFAVFQQSIGATVQEAVVPLETRNPAAFEIWFDNTTGYATGIALANTSSQPASIPVVIHDETGAILLSVSIQLVAAGHTSFDLATVYAMTSGRRGTIEFDTPSGGQISVLGLRFNPTGAFTTVPALTK